MFNKIILLLNKISLKFNFNITGLNNKTRFIKRLKNDLNFYLI